MKRSAWRCARTWVVWIALAAMATTASAWQRGGGRRGGARGGQQVEQVERRIQALMGELREIREGETAARRTLSPSWTRALQWRGIGPSVMVGRITDLAVYDDDPTIVYVGSASGGVWKSTNAGTSFRPIFEQVGSMWIGDVAVAPSNPDILWVGTGEENPRNSVSYGDGVYKSIDGGRTFERKGLETSFQISGIQIHPTNPDIVYVAALGRLWGPGGERGLYKTTDGGDSWTRVHYVDEDTGVIDVIMDPKNPDTLIFATYERRRSLYDNIPNYDPEVKWSEKSSIYKTTDGGATFKELTQGLPTVRMGRVGLDYHRADPNVVYALVESEYVAMGREELEQMAAAGFPSVENYGRNAGQRAHPSSYGGQQANVQEQQGEHGWQAGGTYRSNDGGETWTRVNSAHERPMYFTKIRVDPSDPDKVWILGLGLQQSDDGGATFRRAGGRAHSDYHAMWIDPRDGRHVIIGNDGGVYQSWDWGSNWTYHNSIVASQFYHVWGDNRSPYWVYGGLQDNGSWGAPSRHRNGRGQDNYDWISISGGDGFVVVVDPEDPDIVYSESQDGNMNARNIATGESWRIRPATNERQRFNWDTPMILSNHNSRIFYTASQYVWKSLDRGRDLKQISPDITRTERGSAVRLGESPRNPDVVWVGTDDGFVWVTRDGGGSWTNVSENIGAPVHAFISSIEPSRFEEGRTYIAIDGRRSDHEHPLVYVTEDFGETWTNLQANLPMGNATHVLREDVRNENVLYLGTEFAMYASVDRGKDWTVINNNMPHATVHDLFVHPTAGELIAGTHGRGVWIVDVSALREITPEVLTAKASLLDPHPAIDWGYAGPNRGDQYGNQRFTGDPAPSGAMLYYTLTGPAESVSLRVIDINGDTIADLGGETAPGLHRANWNLRRTGGGQARGGRGGGQARGGRGGGGGRRGGRGGGGGGAAVGPGVYRVVLTVDGEEMTRTVRVEADPGR